MTSTNAIDRAIDVFGSQVNLARAIGVTNALVSNWVCGGNIAAHHCPTIERVTYGAVKCEELRPDIEWQVLRQKPTRRKAKSEVSA